MFKKSILPEVKAIPNFALPRLTLPVGNGTPEIIGLLLSDLQAGHLTKSFNMEVLKDRLLTKLVDRIISIKRVQSADHEVDTMYVFMLGDMIQNDAIGKLVSINELEMTTWKQIKFTTDILCEFFLKMSQIFKKVVIKGVSGNHGKVSLDAGTDMNFDHIIYEFTRLRLQNFTNIEFELQEPDIHFLFCEIYNTKFCIEHGDSCNSRKKQEDEALTMYAEEEEFDILCIGHLHNIEQIKAHKGVIEIWTNGTFVSDDQYTKKKYRAKNKPEQYCFMVHPHKGITARYHLYLE